MVNDSWPCQSFIHTKHAKRSYTLPWPAAIRFALLLCLALALSACATYGEHVAPVPLPSAQADHVNIHGVKVIARAFGSEEAANEAFGFDIRGAGLFPIRFVIDNQSGSTAQVRADQIFLIDAKGQAWPLLTAQQAYERIRNYVELGETAVAAGKPAVLFGAAGALAGLAIGVVTGQDIGAMTAKGAAAGAAAGALYGGAKR